MAEGGKYDKIIEIVKAMNSQGLSISDIRDSLRQTGVKEEDIEMILEKASAEPTPKDIHEAVKMVEEKVSEPLVKTVSEHKQLTQEVRDKVEDLSLGMEEHVQALDQISTNLDEHREKLEQIHESVQDLGEKHEELHGRVKEITSMYDEFSELREILLDIKAMIASLKDLDNKILEINKEMLMRLKK